MDSLRYESMLPEYNLATLSSDYKCERYYTISCLFVLYFFVLSRFSGKYFNDVDFFRGKQERFIQKSNVSSYFVLNTEFYSLTKFDNCVNLVFLVEIRKKSPKNLNITYNIQYSYYKDQLLTKFGSNFVDSLDLVQVNPKVDVIPIKALECQKIIGYDQLLVRYQIQGNLTHVKRISAEWSIDTSRNTTFLIFTDMLIMTMGVFCSYQYLSGADHGNYEGVGKIICYSVSVFLIICSFPSSLYRRFGDLHNFRIIVNNMYNQLFTFLNLFVLYKIAYSENKKVVTIVLNLIICLFHFVVSSFNIFLTYNIQI